MTIWPTRGWPIHQSEGPETENGLERPFGHIGDHPHREATPSGVTISGMKNRTRKNSCPDRLRAQERQPGADDELHGTADKNRRGRIERADGIARKQRGAEDPAEEDGHRSGNGATEHRTQVAVFHER